MRFPAAMIATALVALSVPGLVSADDHEEFDQAGPYFGVGIAGSSYRDGAKDVLGKIDGQSSKPQPSPGYDLRAGFRLHPAFSVEAMFQHSPNVGVNSADLKKFRMDIMALTANAKMHFGTGDYQPYISAGIGQMWTDLKGASSQIRLGDTEKEFTMRFGGGIELVGTTHFVFAFDAAILTPTGSLRGFNQVTFGVLVLARQ